MQGKFQLSWVKSTTDGVTRQVIHMTNDGAVSTLDLAPDVEQVDVTVSPGKSFSWQVESVKDFVSAMSAADNFVCPDLTPPAAATNLANTLTGVVDDTTS